MKLRRLHFPSVKPVFAFAITARNDSFVDPPRIDQSPQVEKLGTRGGARPQLLRPSVSPLSIAGRKQPTAVLRSESLVFREVAPPAAPPTVEEDGNGENNECGDDGGDRERNKLVRA